MHQQSPLVIGLSTQKITYSVNPPLNSRDSYRYMRLLEKEISKRVAQELKKRGISQTELAKRAEIHQGHLNTLMNLKPGKRWNVDNLDSVAKALHIPAWHLLTDPETVLPPEYRQWKSDYDSLDDDRKRIVDDIMVAARVRREENGKKKQTV